jgi:hypothetical protein
VPQLAKFKTPFLSPDIDEENGLIKNCRIATLNAISIAEEGDGRGMVMDSRMIEGLLVQAKAKGDRIPAFFSHDWLNDDSKTDPIHSDAGVWHDFAIDTGGNLVANFQAFETPYKAGIFSRAKLDPAGIAVSPIFKYQQRNGDARFCDPTNFVSSDFVKAGAINKALFSATQKITHMAISLDDLKEVFATPEGKAMVQGCIDGHDKAEDTAKDDADAAEMESDAGVEDEDKKKEDDQKPALMRATLRIARNINRKIAKLAADKVAILAEAKTQAGAEATAVLGKSRFIAAGDQNNPENPIAKFNAAVKALTDSGVKEGAAIQAVMSKQPELYNAANSNRFKAVQTR